MPNEFFYLRELTDLDIEIYELSLITPYYIKRELPTVENLYFKINKSLLTSGRDLYSRYKNILIEAEGLFLSGQTFQYKNYKKRILLNYALGFIKNTVNEMMMKKKDKNV